jgi:hypothetical protein
MGFIGSEEDCIRARGENRKFKLPTRILEKQNRLQMSQVFSVSAH